MKSEREMKLSMDPTKTESAGGAQRERGRQIGWTLIIAGGGKREWLHGGKDSGKKEAWDVKRK